jgi:hypothetical protein
MHHLAGNITRYLNQTLGEHVTLRPWDWTDRLPLFLRDRYAFVEGDLFECPLLFMVAQTTEEETPATIRKHITQLQKKVERPVVYVREHITTYNRRRLIEHRVPLVVPDKQMYLPMLGIDLRERFGTVKKKVSKLSPSSQAILIHFLLSADDEAPLTPAQIAPHLGYAPITLSRAFDELESAELLESSSAGRSRQLRFVYPKHETWNRAQPLLRSPVKHLHYIQGGVGDLQNLAAGLSALAARSMLTEPLHPVIAVSRKNWVAACQHGAIEQIPMRDAGTVDVEVWSYSPHILSANTIVDPLSLYLSLHDEADERVDSALEEMLEAVPW